MLGKRRRHTMQENRRDFLKKALGTSAVVATAGVSGALASSKETGTKGNNGVIYGKSPKKEILYKETDAWKLYYKRSY